MLVLVSVSKTLVNFFAEAFEPIRTSLISDIPECPSANWVVHRNRHHPDIIVIVGMFVAKHPMIALSTNRYKPPLVH